MTVLMLKVGNDGVVNGYHTGARKVDDPRYVVVDEVQFNKYTELIGRESMVYDGKEFHVIPDSRPEITINAPSEHKVGEPMSIDVVGPSGKDVLLEYQTPEGRVGLIKVHFDASGMARVSLVPNMSGRYLFLEADGYKTKGAFVSVFEE